VGRRGDLADDHEWPEAPWLDHAASMTRSPDAAQRSTVPKRTRNMPMTTSAFFDLHSVVDQSLWTLEVQVG